MKLPRPLFPPYKDLGGLAEDDRIREIGEKCMRDKLVVGFVVDDEPDKPERYIRKLKERWPGIRVEHVGPGPVAETILVRVGPPVN